MLNVKVKYLTFFKPWKWKKGGNFDQGWKKIDFNQNLGLYRMQVILGR